MVTVGIVALTMIASLCAAAPFPYVWSKAYHILPGTTSEESGYFSLCEGLNKRIYIGTAKYQSNAYLVEFNPTTEQQRIVIDVNQVCSLTATGYAAQAKIHTRNYVGPSGTIYAGSKQGYRIGGDTNVYPGGYLVTYDPASDMATNLGMPYPTQGIIDTVADETRKLIYIVTCEEQHWMLFNQQSQQFTELAATGTPYATTLVDARGIANLLTTNFGLAQYNPDTARMITRPIYADGQPFTRTNGSAIPTWNLHPDRTNAYLILMNDPRLLKIDLLSTGTTVTAHYVGKMLEGTGPDSRSALSVAPDGKVFAVVSVVNTTGYIGGSASGTHRLHHLTFYDPRDESIHDLGVLAVQNNDWYTFTTGNPNMEPAWAHGFEQLPDGVITPRYNHMALLIAADYSAYVTIIYPFTLLHIAAGNMAFSNVVATTSPAHGSIIPDGTLMVPHGGSTNFQITADPYFHIERVIQNNLDSGLTFPPSCTNAVFTWTNILGDSSIQAVIAPNLVTNGVAEWWLANHKLTNEGFTAGALADNDHDGQLNWQEYLAGTDPTNACSLFKITGMGTQAGSNYVVWTGGGETDLPPYVIQRRTNDWEGDWEPAAYKPHSPLTTSNIWFDTQSVPAAYYRVAVTN